MPGCGRAVTIDGHPGRLVLLRIILALVAVLTLAGCQTRLPVAPTQAGPARASAPLGGGDLPAWLADIDPEILKKGPWKFRSVARAVAIPHAEFEDASPSVQTYISSFRVGASKRLGMGASIDLDVVWENRKYEWSGTNDFLPNTDIPITMTNGFGLNARYIQPFHPKWAAFVDLAGRLEAEKGAPLSDGASWGAFAGVGRVFLQRKADLAFGFGVITRPGGQIFYLPIVQGRWQINDRWDVKFRGPVLTLTAKASEKWTLAGVVAFDSARIRLTDSPPGNSGIFTDSRFTSHLRVTYSPIKSLDLEAWVGLDFWRTLYFSSEDDSYSRSFRVKPAPIFGTRIVVRF